MQDVDHIAGTRSANEGFQDLPAEEIVDADGDCKDGDQNQAAALLKPDNQQDEKHDDRDEIVFIGDEGHESVQHRGLQMPVDPVKYASFRF